MVSRIRGKHHMTGQLSDFQIADGLIETIDPPSDGVATLGGEGYWVAPGLIDIQVNGYRGHDLCAENISPEEVMLLANDLGSAGVTAFCPTVTTNSFEAMESSLRAIARACETSDAVRYRVLGIHLEGPYISPQDGPRGAHPAQYVHAPDWAEFTRLQEASAGRIRIVTVAPELPGAIEFIAHASRLGLVVAIGHHAATREHILRAMDAGAVLCTHLGNGAHNQLPRHPNYIWEQLANDGLMASIVLDGHHLPPSVVKTFYRTKGPDRLILTSDAIAAAGLPVGKYKLMGQEVELLADGSVHLSGTAYLAGSALRLSDAIRNVMRFASCGFAEAITMASLNPARLLGLERERGALRIGMPADLTLFRDGPNGPELAATIVRGEISYQTS